MNCIGDRKMYDSHVLEGHDGDVFITLDPQYHPIQPDKSCPESVAIYNEHKDLAAEYLKVQEEIQIQSQRMESLAGLAERLNETEEQYFDSTEDPDEEEEVRKLEEEKESLLQLHRDLKQQLDLIQKNKLKSCPSPSPSSSSSSGGSGGWVASPHPT
uniref:Mitogen-activated protein kinase kinase kinase 7 n=1 Tax=Cacopsylla melanoneura TaxID=428564 RepID=A0A8D9B7Q7_9HEMI